MWATVSGAMSGRNARLITPSSVVRRSVIDFTTTCAKECTGEYQAAFEKDDSSWLPT
jgi:hypothetical protein